MKSVLIALTVFVLSACTCLAQQSPPADGVGLGNDHLNSNSSTSNVPSMSPDQNSVMTDSNGSVTGDKAVPAFAGAPPADASSQVNSQGTAAASDSATSTAARRRSYNRTHAVQQTQAPAKMPPSGPTAKKISSPPVRSANQEKHQK